MHTMKPFGTTERFFYFYPFHQALQAMRTIISVLSILTLTTMSQAQIPSLYLENKTPTYDETIAYFKHIDSMCEDMQMRSYGTTDAGFPLDVLVIDGDKQFTPEAARAAGKAILLINNGIHPGEPDGIDASMLLARDIVINKYKISDNVVLAIIPVYNIGGCLNRSTNYRVDQDGPVEKGFRGNSQNLDLNRDFIKCDSKDARSFTEIFHQLDPDVFIDNHVSNGADYQHIITLLTSQHNKLGGAMGEFLEKTFEPGLYTSMKTKGYDLVPYVNSFGDTPENGWPEYWDSPRYGSGYGSLWHTFSFVPETHMLKPYEQRVKATYALMQSFIEFTSNNSNQIKILRQQAKQISKTATTFPLSWSLDKSNYKEVVYKGYEAGRKPSEISWLPRLYYDRNKPFEKTVKIFNYYTVKSEVAKPKAYIIPQGWWKVIDLLKLNKVEMTQLKKIVS